MNLKEKKYLLLDLDGVCYGKHNNYSLERVFGQVSKRMTQFISEKLKIDKDKAKELQTNYFYKYNTSLNGLMIHHDIPPQEFLEYVHAIDLSFMKEDKIIIAIPRGRIIKECQNILNKTTFAPDPLLFDENSRNLTFSSKSTRSSLSHLLISMW